MPVTVVKAIRPIISNCLGLYLVINVIGTPMMPSVVAQFPFDVLNACVELVLLVLLGLVQARVLICHNVSGCCHSPPNAPSCYCLPG